MAKLEDHRLYLDQLSRLFEKSYQNLLEQKKNDMRLLVSKLDGLSPLGTMARGYSILKDEDGRVVKQTGQVKRGDHLRVMVADGEIPVCAE